jgi:RnfABCDGE-type electron transport complex G subunit
MSENRSAMMENIKTVLVIVLIAGGAAALLAMVKLATADAIAAAELAETKKGVSLVMPKDVKVDVTKTIEMNNGEKAEVYYAGLNDAGEVTAIAVKTYSKKGYSGKIGVLVGYTGLESPETLKVNRIYILSHAETPGLGAKINVCQQESDPEKCDGAFWTKYWQLPVDETTLSVTKDNPNGAIVAITSATISTRAITGSVLETGLFVKENLDKIKAELLKANAAQGDK